MEEEHNRFVAAAETALSDTFGGPVRLGAGGVLRRQGRNRVLRCSVVGGPAGVPASVILKASVSQGERVYDPEDDGPESAARRFRNEWTATRFLNEHAADSPLCARLLGGSPDAGLIVLEDLGDGPCLADALQGSDPAHAEAALETYAASLGRLHALTVGGEAAWRRLRNEIGGSETAGEPEGARRLRESANPFCAQCESLGVPLAPGLDADLEAIERTLDNPGPFLAFAPGDTCPDNHRLLPGSRYLRFFDFEFAGFRHALLDAAYFHLPFPTCWCVSRLPEPLPLRIEAVYRAELVRGCPEASDDALFYPAMSHACAFWTIMTLSGDLESALKEDGRWGLSTLRQRHPLRLETFVRVARRFGHLPALTDTARALAEKLRALWPGPESEMPLYPPFRPQPED